MNETYTVFKSQLLVPTTLQIKSWRIETFRKQSKTFKVNENNLELRTRIDNIDFFLKIKYSLSGQLAYMILHFFDANRVCRMTS